MRTALCESLGIEHPIIAAPMGPDISGADLVAAVSNAGGFGILQAQFAPLPLFREEIRRVRSLTSKPFGVNLLLHFPCEEQFAVCLEERVPAVSFFWGDATPWVARAHAAGVKILHQVGSAADAVRSARAGTDVIVAQGFEAGGHVAGKVSTLVLVPRVVDAVSPTPVAAAGGIADARGVAAVLALGAQAAVLGTRFLASDESRAHPEYKRRLVTASEEDTVHTILFGWGWPNAPHRALRTPFVDAWLGKEARAQESREDEEVVGTTVFFGRETPMRRFWSVPPNVDARGDLGSMGLLAGQSVGAVDRVRPAGELVRELARDADALIRRLADRPASRRA